MGCDIHICVEVQLANGRWEFFGYTSMNRSYSMFTRIAGVRAELTASRGEKIEPIALPRGIPDDISPLTKAHVQDWDCDGHSHTWLSSDEFRELDKWRKQQWPKEDYWSSMLDGFWFFGNHLEDWRPSRPAEAESPIQDYRLVIWFDS